MVFFGRLLLAPRCLEQVRRRRATIVRLHQLQPPRLPRDRQSVRAGLPAPPTQLAPAVPSLSVTSRAGAAPTSSVAPTGPSLAPSVGSATLTWSDWSSLLRARSPRRRPSRPT